MQSDDSTYYSLGSIGALLMDQIVVETSPKHKNTRVRLIDLEALLYLAAKTNSSHSRSNVVSEQS